MCQRGRAREEDEVEERASWKRGVIGANRILGPSIWLKLYPPFLVRI